MQACLRESDKNADTEKRKRTLHDGAGLSRYRSLIDVDYEDLPRLRTRAQIDGEIFAIRRPRRHRIRSGCQLVASAGIEIQCPEAATYLLIIVSVGNSPTVGRPSDKRGPFCSAGIRATFGRLAIDDDECAVLEKGHARSVRRYRRPPGLRDPYDVRRLKRLPKSNGLYHAVGARVKVKSFSIGRPARKAAHGNFARVAIFGFDKPNFFAFAVMANVGNCASVRREGRILACVVGKRRVLATC